MVSFVCNSKEVKAGDILVFRLPGRNLPIIHRAVAVHISRYAQSLNIISVADFVD